MPLTHVHHMAIPSQTLESLALAQKPKIDSTRNTPKHLHDLYDRQLAVRLFY